MHNPYCYLDSICPQDPARDPDPTKEAPVAKTPKKTVTVEIRPDILAAQVSIKTLIRENLQLYSEWLDVAGLMKKPKKKDRRSHEDLVTEYLGA